MNIFIIIIIVICCLPLLRRFFNWLFRKLLLHQLKKQTGIDFDFTGRRKETEEGRSDGGSRRGRRRRRPSRGSEGPIIPREYAEDVDFTEVKEFSETDIASESAGDKTFREESQVSDVEYVEIKNRKSQS